MPYFALHPGTGLRYEGHTSLSAAAPRWLAMRSSERQRRAKYGGETRNRTVDTRIFSPVRALLENIEFLSKQGYIRRLSQSNYCKIMQLNAASSTFCSANLPQEVDGGWNAQDLKCSEEHIERLPDLVQSGVKRLFELRSRIVLECLICFRQSVELRGGSGSN